MIKVSKKIKDDKYLEIKRVSPNSYSATLLATLYCYSSVGAAIPSGQIGIQSWGY
jgi:hypothetical protein